MADSPEVRLFAGEPDVRQPISVSFDDRGRAWVLQSLQSPIPRTKMQISSNYAQALQNDGFVVVPGYFGCCTGITSPRQTVHRLRTTEA